MEITFLTLKILMALDKFYKDRYTISTILSY